MAAFASGNTINICFRCAHIVLFKPESNSASFPFKAIWISKFLCSLISIIDYYLLVAKVQTSRRNRLVKVYAA